MYILRSINKNKWYIMGEQIKHLNRDNKYEISDDAYYRCYFKNSIRVKKFLVSEGRGESLELDIGEARLKKDHNSLVFEFTFTNKAKGEWIN